MKIEKFEDGLAICGDCTSQEVIDKADALIPRLALLDGLQRSVARSDVLREAIRRGLADMERTLPTLTEGGHLAPARVR